MYLKALESGRPCGYWELLTYWTREKDTWTQAVASSTKLGTFSSAQRTWLLTYLGHNLQVTRLNWTRLLFDGTSCQ